MPEAASDDADDEVEEESESHFPIEESPAEIYEDDFEEYESDFEEDDEETYDEVQIQSVSENNSQSQNYEARQNINQTKMSTEAINQFGAEKDKDNQQLNGNDLLDDETRELIAQSRLMTRVATASIRRPDSSTNVTLIAKQRTPENGQLPKKMYQINKNYKNMQDTNETDEDDAVDAVDPMSLLKLSKEELEERMRSSKFYKYFQQIADPNATKKLTYTQTGEDNVTIGCQTDPPFELGIFENKAVQCAIPSGTFEKTDRNGQNDKLGEWSIIPLDAQPFLRPVSQPQKLQNFVQRTGQLIVNLIKMEHQQAANKRDTDVVALDYNSNVLFSARYSVISPTMIGLVPNTDACILRGVLISVGNGKGGISYSDRLILGAEIKYDERMTKAQNLNDEEGESFFPLKIGTSLLMEFDVFDPSLPKRIFSMPSNELSACCYSDDEQILFAGMKDGSIIGWDLRATLSVNFPRINLKYQRNRVSVVKSDASVPVVPPVFSTASEVVLVKRNVDQLLGSVPDRSVSQVIALYVTQNGKNLFALHELGVISLWAVSNEREQPYVYLSRRSTVHCWQAPIKGYKLSLTAKSLAVKEGETCCHCLVGTSNGMIISASNQSGTLNTQFPRQYGEAQFGVDVLSIRINPFNSGIFVSINSRHEIALFNETSSMPFRRLSASPLGRNFMLRLKEQQDLNGQTNGSPQIEWSSITSGILYSIHGDRLLVWSDIEDYTKTEPSVQICDLTKAAVSTPIVSSCVWRRKHVVEETEKHIEQGFMAILTLNADVMVHALEPNFIPTANQGT